jgi:uncharacterized protein involved in exopolysaccharide biosynthesis
MGGTACRTSLDPDFVPESSLTPLHSFDGVTLPAQTAWPMRAYLHLALILGTVGLLTALIAFLVVPREYTSTSAVTVTNDVNRNISGQLGALGGVLGLAAGENQNPQYIAGLVTSRDVLSAVIRHKVKLPGAADSAMLASVLLRGPVTTPADFDKAREELEKSISTDVELRTGVIDIAVTLRGAQVAERVNTLLIQLTDSLNQAMRRGQASRRRQFVARRLEIAKQELQAAEDSQRAFWQANSVRSSPALMLEDRRLERAIGTRQDVFTGLSRDYESSLQDEVRDVPSLNVFTEPNVPWKKSKPRGSFYVLAGVGTGVLLATLIIALLVMTNEDAAMPRSAGEATRALLRRGTSAA